jgi:methionyl-tRNA formyltransferase
MVDALRIVFMGTPAFAVPTLERLLASRHPVVGVVTQPDKPRGRGQKVSDAPVKVLALERGLPITQPARLREPDVEATLRAWQPDLGVVAAYGKLIPEAILTIPREGMINVHASLLPKYRGAAPIHRAVINGEAETGVTIMRVIRELDAGAMFAKAVRPIGAEETSDVVERDLARIGADLLVSIVDRIADGTASEVAQDDSLATFAPRLTKEEGLIDWTLPAPRIHDRVRGLHPWPHAYTFLDGHRTIVLRSLVEPADARRACSGDVSLAPGTVTHVSHDAIHVATGDAGMLAIVELQLEGRRPMRARDFLAGRPVRAGTVLGAP